MSPKSSASTAVSPACSFETSALHASSASWQVPMTPLPVPSEMVVYSTS